MTEERDYSTIKPRFDRALRLRDEGRTSEAEAVLSALAEEYPAVAAVHGMLGDVRERMGKLLESGESYKRAAELSPGSELASISLFHVLYAQGDLDGAFEEMRRFRRRGPSPEYDQLISDLQLNLKDE